MKAACQLAESMGRLLQRMDETQNTTMPLANRINFRTISEDEPELAGLCNGTMYG